MLKTVSALLVIFSLGCPGPSEEIKFNNECLEYVKRCQTEKLRDGLERGFDPNFFSRQSMLETAIIFGCPKNLELLIKNGGIIHGGDHDVDQLLGYAYGYFREDGDLRMLEILLKNGAGCGDASLKRNIQHHGDQKVMDLLKKYSCW